VSVSVKRKPLHYGWVVAGAAFFALLASAGIRATPGVLILPLEHEFGWSAATISSAIALNIVLFGLAGPFAAALMQRVGVRPVVAAALGFNSLAVAATMFVRQPWQLVLIWGVCVGLSTGLIANVLAATIATRWFKTSRGVVVGLLSASVSTGQLVFLPLLATLVAGPGWRVAVGVVAATALLVAVPVVLLLREWPANLGIPPFGGTEIELPPQSKGNPLLNALRELRAAAGARDFQLLAATFFVCGASTNGLIGTHFIPACGDHGIPEVKAAGFLAAMGVLDLLGTTFSGYLSDRMDSRILLFWYYGLRGLSLLVLPAALNLGDASLTLFTLFYGLDWIATIPPTLKLTNAAFGTIKGPILYGWIVASHQLGAGAAALFAGIVRTVFGTYDPSFWVSGALCLIAAGLALAIGRKRLAPLGPKPQTA
jgi:predicted MFS family arabinose efflux permease